MTSQPCEESEAGEHYGAARRLRDRGENKVEVVYARGAYSGLLNPNRVVGRSQQWWCKPGRSERRHRVSDLGQDIVANVSGAIVPVAEKETRVGRSRHRPHRDRRAGPDPDERDAQRAGA